MLWIAIAFSALVVAFILLGISFKQKNWKLRPRQILCILCLLLIIPGIFATIPAGHTGILTTFGKVEDQTLEAGLHTVLPWQQVICMDNRAQKASVDMSCFSSDIQEVSVIYSVNYQIRKENAQKIYKTIGVNSYNTVMTPCIQQAVKSVIAEYTAESLISSREELSKKILEVLTPALEEYNIIVINTAVEDLDFSDVFTNAVEEKQVAQQKKLKAETEQEQLNLEAKAKAEREKIAAEAEAEVNKIKADTEKYAKEQEGAANKALAESLTDELIKYFEINAWDGKLPSYYVTGTETVLPILGGTAGSQTTPDTEGVTPEVTPEA